MVGVTIQQLQAEVVVVQLQAVAVEAQQEVVVHQEVVSDKSITSSIRITQHKYSRHS